MVERNVAQLLLEAASRDLRACDALAAIADIHDSIIGFHAQQTIEKSLKAVLVRADVAFRRTHDVAELLDAIIDNSLSLPPHAEPLDELQPYAVDARYGLIQPGPLNRDDTQRIVADVWRWAADQVDGPSGARL